MTRLPQEWRVALIIAVVALALAAFVYTTRHSQLDLGVPAQPTYPPTTKGAP